MTSGTDPALHLALLGASGRMGRALFEALAAMPDGQSAAICISGALASQGNPGLGQDAAGLLGHPACGANLTDDLNTALAGADVAIDFTLPDCLGATLTACQRHGCALLSGVTGLAADDLQQLRDVAAHIPILHAPNMSTGVNVAFELAALAARLLGPAYDVEILETHHNAKRDAPSGTALRFGEVIAAQSGQRLEDIAAGMGPGEDRHGARLAGSIGFASLRGGDIPGEHTVMFAGPGERIEITHRAGSRAAFANGALQAVRWLRQQPPGLYSMADMVVA